MLKSSCSQSDPLRILLTGATGSLGSNVVAEAARCGLEVRAVLLGTPNDFAAYNGIPGGGQPCRSPISVGRLAATRNERASCVRRPRHPRATPGPARSTIKQAPVLMDTRRAWLRRGVSSRTAGQSAGNFPPRSNSSLDCSAR